MIYKIFAESQHIIELHESDEDGFVYLVVLEYRSNKRIATIKLPEESCKELQAAFRLCRVNSEIS